jgi:Zn-dependent protease with chaperone function
MYYFSITKNEEQIIVTIKRKNMETQAGFTVNAKENFYFTMKVIVSVIIYGILLYVLFNAFSFENPIIMKIVPIFVLYVIFFIVLLVFQFGILIGYLKGNAIKVGKNQFPDIYQIVEKQATILELKNIPTVYILQSGGILNAFATRFLGRNYIVLYSEIVESAYEQDKAILEFIIGHEMGHIKRNHMLKRLLLFPSLLIPFLGSAYSRACEYTCDSIGYCVAPNGLQGGLLLLASGRSIYKKVTVSEYLLQAKEGGFWKWFAEKVSSHPHLSKRLVVFESKLILTPPIPKPIVTHVDPHIETQPIHSENISSEEKSDDHTKYMPR